MDIIIGNEVRIVINWIMIIILQICNGIIGLDFNLEIEIIT